MKESDRLVYCKILKGIPFNESEFAFWVLDAFIITHYLDTNIQQLQYTDEIEKFQDALEEVFKLVKDMDSFNKCMLNIVR